MRITEVDPRSEGSEVSTPTYRVLVWQLDAGGGWGDASYDISETDVTEVAEWARQRAAPAGTFTLYVHCVHDGAPAMLRLQGWEPTRNEPPPPWVS